MRIADQLGTEDLRQIHLAIFQDSAVQYLRSGPFGHAEHRRTEQRIRNVAGTKLRRVIGAVPEFSERGLPAAWSHFMAVAAGTHVWPDANHRTAIVAFDQATRSGLGLTIALAEDDAVNLVVASKAMRDRDFRDRSRYYTIEELADPDHPYRRLLATFEDWLIVEAL